MNSSFDMNILVDESLYDIRLDAYLAQKFDKTRNHFEILIKDGKVKVNGKVITKTSYKTKIDDNIDVVDDIREEIDVVPQDIPLNIIYEDDDILIIDKERGMVVHPANGHNDNTLVNAIMFHCKDRLSTINGVIRPGIVHRIDKDTSGILCICKNDISHNFIQEQFKEHTNTRKYKAIVKGNLKEKIGIIEQPIGRDKNNRLRFAVDKNGKNAITKYKVIESFVGFDFIECELLTGRTHQIRVHMKYLGHPLLGDSLYGGHDKNFKYIDGQVLHAYYLDFIHPTTKKKVAFKSELPIYFENILQKLRNN